MEDIKHVVERIVAECGESGIQVTETLAAFVARTIILEHAEEYQLDKTLEEKDVESLVKRTVERLGRKDCAQMETIRMQVEFDNIFVDTEAGLDREQKAKNSRLYSLKSSIVSMESSGSEFERINAVYRQIFHYLICCVDADKSKDRSVEREIAAGLESVFPKIGLKAFLTMDPDDQKLQLGELAHIVMGIRLFNRQIGKGGAGISDVPGEARKSANSLLDVLLNEKEKVQHACQEYSTTLVFAHRCKNGEGPDPEKVQRWQQELNNRRQLLAFIASLEEDTLHTLETVGKLEEKLEEIMLILQDLVSGRTSVPKDQVYPKFHIASEIWTEIQLELDLIESRHLVWNSLKAFKNSCRLSLDPSWIEAATADEKLRSVEAGRHPEVSESKTDVGERKEEESKEEEFKESKEDGMGEAPVLLKPESTPDFMNLPLEFQGYCPHAIANRKGLLLPGDPSLGVVSYRGTYSVFHSQDAINEFIRNPEAVIGNVLNEAKASPELIHLAELQSYFPETAMHNIFRAQRNKAAQANNSGTYEKPIMVDAATETPTHFVESNIDPTYEWNEWALRRRTLQLVNLRNARTSSTQTVKSHFRRENETQVYLPKDQTSQTGISRGTNPPRKVQYIVGLRGLATSKYIKSNPNARPRRRSSLSNGGFGDSNKALVPHKISPLPEKAVATTVHMTFDL